MEGSIEENVVKVIMEILHWWGPNLRAKVVHQLNKDLAMIEQVDNELLCANKCKWKYKYHGE